MRIVRLMVVGAGSAGGKVVNLNLPEMFTMHINTDRIVAFRPHAKDKTKSEVFLDPELMMFLVVGHSCEEICHKLGTSVG